MEPIHLLWLLTGFVLLLGWRRQATRAQARERLMEARLDGVTKAPAAIPSIPERGVARWLNVAGYREPNAVSTFWTQTALGVLVGLLLVWLWWASDLSDQLTQQLAALPGELGSIVTPALLLVPVLAFVVPALWPTLRVRRARRVRKSAVLQDLQPSIELFASLAQAGLGFDAALARVLTTMGPERPLAREFMAFQAEVLGGADRARALRRMASRVDLPQISGLTSSLVRAQEAGIAVSHVLRRQADDLRSDLREQGLAKAQALPAKMVFPLVICFLPGIFVMSLGPAFYAFLAGTSGFGATR